MRVLGLVWMMAGSGVAQLSGSTVKVIVLDYADAGVFVRQEMMREAGAILAEAGIESEWLECRVPRRDSYPAACEAQLAPTDIILRILPGRAAEAPSALGTSAPRPEGGFRASVYPETVRALAQHTRWTEGDLLGHAAAHEIGHLLLCTGAHAATGIMRGRWSAWDLRQMQHRDLVFSAEESALLAVAVARRAQFPRDKMASSRV